MAPDLPGGFTLPASILAWGPLHDCEIWIRMCQKADGQDKVQVLKSAARSFYFGRELCRCKLFRKKLMRCLNH